MSKYKHIEVGESDDYLRQYECASIKTDDADENSILEVSMAGGKVLFTEACDYHFSREMTKADAIAALEELIDYIRSEGK